MRWKKPVGAGTEEIGDGDNEKEKEKREIGPSSAQDCPTCWLSQRPSLLVVVTRNAKDGTNFHFSSWCKSTKMEGEMDGREQESPLPWSWTECGAVSGWLSLVVGASLCAWSRSLAPCLATSTSTGLPSTLVRLDRATGAVPADPLVQ